MKPNKLKTHLETVHIERFGKKTPEFFYRKGEGKAVPVLN